MNHLGMFAKYWEAGAVKTRLARRLGAESASVLYGVFLRTLVHRFAMCGDRRWLAFTPADRESAFLELSRDQWELTPQTTGDLGTRIDAFFTHVMATGGGSDRVVLIGSDSPSLPVSYVEEAFVQLDHYPIVLGPSTDGGFYLIGAAGTPPPRLRGIPWSTENVFQTTVRQLGRAGLRSFHLPPWYDVDEHHHLMQLDSELSKLTDQQEDLVALAKAVREAITDAGE